MLISCEEEDVYSTPAVYAGRYTYKSSEVEFAFELVREHGVYKGINGRVTHEAISHSEGRDNLIVTKNFNGTGYERILIRSHVPVYWSIDLVGVQFTADGMNVGEIRVMMPGREDVTLAGQFVGK